jgi:hypothetical protein
MLAKLDVLHVAIDSLNCSEAEYVQGACTAVFVLTAARPNALPRADSGALSPKRCLC